MEKQTQEDKSLPIDFLEMSKTIFTSIDHYRECGKEDKFSIQSIAEYLERQYRNLPSIQEACHCTPDQTTGHTAGKCNVCGKEDLEAASIKHADSLHKKGSSELAGNGKLTENDCWENAYFNFNEGYKASK